MPSEFENGGFTLKMHQIFYVQTTPEEFENATGHFGFVVEENSGGEISLLSKDFPSTRNRKAVVFKFLRFEERFRKAPFW